jgi:hypothetical protein
MWRKKVWWYLLNWGEIRSRKQIDWALARWRKISILRNSCRGLDWSKWGGWKLTLVRLRLNSKKWLGRNWKVGGKGNWWRIDNWKERGKVNWIGIRKGRGKGRGDFRLKFWWY